MPGVPTQRSAVEGLPGQSGVQRAATPAASADSSSRWNAGSVAVRYWAPWSKLAAAKRRVARRPPGARCASKTRTLTPASARRSAQASPARPAPTTATEAAFMLAS